MPKGCVIQLLACNKQYKGELKTLLKENRDVFPIEVPRRAPINRRLVEKMEIKLMPGTEPIQKKMCR